MIESIRFEGGKEVFQYFNDFYINMKYGPSYILTEVLVVVVGVVLLTDISFFKNLMTNLKDLAFFALKLIGSFVCVLFIESLLYAFRTHIRSISSIRCS